MPNDSKAWMSDPRTEFHRLAVSMGPKNSRLIVQSLETRSQPDLQAVIRARARLPEHLIVGAVLHQHALSRMQPGQRAFHIEQVARLQRLAVRPNNQMAPACDFGVGDIRDDVAQYDNWKSSLCKLELGRPKRPPLAEPILTAQP